MYMKLRALIALTHEDKKFVTRVFIIVTAVFALIGVGFWITQRATVHKGEKEEHANAVKPKTEIADLFGGKKESKLLAIDIEAHEAALRQHKDDMTPEEAIQHLLRILSVEQGNRSVRLELASQYLKAARYSDALESFLALFEENVSDSLTERIMALYGLALFYNGRLNESVEQLEKTINKYPASSEAYGYRGQIEAAMNMASEKSEYYFKKSLEINPRYADAYYQLARYYMNKPNVNDSDYYKARVCLEKQLEIEPLNPKVHSRLGMVYYYLDMPDVAEKSYKTALTLNNSDFNTHYNLGELYYSLFDDKQKALIEFKKTIQLRSDHVEANFKIGLIALENNMDKEAAAYLEAAHSKEPKNIRILRQLGVAYEKLGMVKKAVGVYNTILGLNALDDIALQKLKMLNYNN